MAKAKEAAHKKTTDTADEIVLARHAAAAGRLRVHRAKADTESGELEAGDRVCWAAVANPERLYQRCAFNDARSFLAPRVLAVEKFRRRFGSRQVVAAVHVAALRGLIGDDADAVAGLARPVLAAAAFALLAALARPARFPGGDPNDVFAPRTRAAA